MSYDLDGMIAKFRREMEDTVEPYLFSEEEVIDFLGEAEDEFAQVVDVIPAEITIDYLADDTHVTIPDYVSRVRDAENGAGEYMKLVNHEEWHEALSSDDYGMFSVTTSWRTQTDTYPKALITDTSQLQARMYPVPTADGTLTLHVYRRPLKSLEERGILEIKDRMQQRTMLLKAKAIAYRKHDAEVYNPQLAQELELQFENRLLEMKSRVHRARRRSKGVAYGGL